jgi:NADH-quinone oxidoreductase subunit F
MTEYILLRHREIPDLDKLSVYREHGGFETFRKVVTTLKPVEVLNMVKESGLRGRGGAGFPTGTKWSFLPADLWPHYVVANADESEPGTFKDREIMVGNPYQFLEGLMISCYAVQAQTGYIYLRGEFWEVAEKLDACIAELEKANLLGDNLFGKDYHLRIYTHLGAGAYICGEETAMLESIEGKRGQPRVKPPFPAVAGLYDRPTVINNVETLANVAPIVEKGPAWFRSFGTEKSPGAKIFSLSGRVNKPGNYELPLGTTFRELIYNHGGGIIDGAKIKAIMPAGASSALIPADDRALDTPMDWESVPALGCPLGSASVMILDETISAAWAIHKTLRFFQHESCGKCTPCREGTYWMKKVIDKLMRGDGAGQDIDLLLSIAKTIPGMPLCPLGDFSVPAVISAIEKFRPDFEALVRS